jgi:hypothetical protein
MSHPKRTIPVSEVRPGDSIRIGGHVRFVTSAAPWHDWIEQVVLTCAPMVGLRRTFWVDIGAALTAGFTNRKAKRARGKMARRQRFAARRTIRGAAYSFTYADEAGSWGGSDRAFVDAQAAAIASSISPSDDAAIIRQTRIAGRSPGPIPRLGQATADGTARIESVTFTADTQHGLTSVVTKTRPIMSHDAAAIVGQRVDISCGYGSASPARDGLSLPMSATLAAAEESALITRNVPGMDGINAKTGRAWWDR